MARKAQAPDNTAVPPTGADNSGKTPAETTAAPKKVGRPPGQSTKDGDVFKAVDPAPSDINSKVAPQAQAIANIVRAAGTNGITRKDLVAQMEGVVTTRQPQGRILSYYQKLLIEKGHVTVTPAPSSAGTEPAAPAAETAA